MTVNKFVIFSATLSIATGLLVLIGWVLDISTLKSILPIWVSMKVNTALCFVLLGFSLLCSAQSFSKSDKFPGLFSGLKTAALLLVGLISLLTLSEYLFSCNLGLDQWLIKEPPNTFGTTYPGRMAPETATCFVLVVSSLLFINEQKELSASLGLVVLNLSLVAILSYLTPQLGPFGWFGQTIMSMNTAVLFAMLGVTIIVMVWQDKAAFWSLANQSTLAFIISLFLLVFIGFNTSRCQFWLNQANDKIVLNQDFSVALDGVLTEVIEAQTNDRAYLLTKDERFLKLYDAAQTNVLAQLRVLSKLDLLVHDLPKQTDFKPVETEIKKQLAWYRYMIKTKQDGLSEVNLADRLEHGTELLITLRNMIEQIKTQHLSIAQQLKQESDRVAGFSYSIILIGTFVSVVTFLLGFFKLNQIEIRRRKTEKELRENEAMLGAITDNTDTVIFIKDLAGRCVFVNQAFEALFHGSNAEIRGKTDYDIFPRDLADKFTKDDQWVIESGESLTTEESVPSDDGIRSYMTVKFPLKKDSGETFAVCGIATDVTKYKKIELELRIAATAFESQESMTITDASGTILRVNPAFSEVTGYSAEEVIGKNPRILQSGRHDAEFYTAMWDSLSQNGAWKGEIWNRRKNGEIYPENLTITAVKNPEGIVTNYVASFSDISIMKAAAEEIEHLAFYDPLTDLPNRVLLRDRLKSAIAASKRNRSKGAVLFIDMDNFKNLNDTLGHDIGDLLLQQAAQRLSLCVRDNDTVARLGGDEFVVVLEDLSREDIKAAAETEVIGTKILALINQPYQLGKHSYSCTTSIGATLFNGHKKNVDDLLKQADIAMYQSKATGRNKLRFFDAPMQEKINARVALDTDLRRAIVENQFQLYYQAQVQHSGKIIGAEVLIRWKHPLRGLVSPVEFIPFAEESDLILAIGLWVLETACWQLKAWTDNDLQLAVNVSARQFRQPDFVQQVCDVLACTGIKPERLKLELTESLVLKDVENAIKKMNLLREIGVRFSMDDFGTGYSSLAYLTRLPLNQLKIDQSFIHNIGIKDSDAVIVQTIIGMANNLGIEVIAEGVETEQQRAFLEQNICLLCQGYLFSKPLPLEQFEALINSSK